MQNQNNSPPQLSRSGLLFNLAYSMVPLFGFWLVEEIYGLEAGIVAAVILAVLEVAWVYYKEKRWEMFSMGSAVLIIGMGLISWKMHNNIAIRLKPAVLEGVFVIIFLGSTMIGKPFMITMARKQFGNVEFSPMQMKYFKGINWRIGILFSIHAAITVYAAIHLSTKVWFFVKGVLFYLLFFAYFIGEFIYSRFFLRRKMAEEAERQRMFLEYQKDLYDRVRKR